jgi:hypothetical protein
VQRHLREQSVTAGPARAPVTAISSVTSLASLTAVSAFAAITPVASGSARATSAAVHAAGEVEADDVIGELRRTSPTLP